MEGYIPLILPGVISDAYLQEDFKPVTLADRAFFENHYAQYPQTHSDNTFTNMVCWNHYAHYQYAYERKNLIIASTIDGTTRFRPPIGAPRSFKLLKSLIRLASDVSDNEPVVLIDPETAGWDAGDLLGIKYRTESQPF